MERAVQAGVFKLSHHSAFAQVGENANVTPNLYATGFTVGITATDIDASLQFYTGGLGFDIEDHKDENGVVQYVSIKAGAAEIGISRDDFAKGADRVKGTGVRMWVTTEQDLDLLAERVKAAGYVLDSEPAPLPWGPRAFTLSDPDGIKLTISSAA
jgi:catechol 2,3-dioxygenase-like lactoylglutathione lyase family enzyme